MESHEDNCIENSAVLVVNSGWCPSLLKVFGHFLAAFSVKLLVKTMAPEKKSIRPDSGDASTNYPVDQ